MLRWVLLIWATLLVASACAQSPSFTAEDRRFFRERVQPLLREHCWSCHGTGAGPEAGLRLVHRSFVMEGGVSGSVIDAEDPANSLLLRKISYGSEDDQMPPAGKLPPAALEVFAEWVRRGAPFEGGPLPRVEVEAEHRGREDGQQGWSYRPLSEAPPPPVEDTSWIRNPVDRYILARLEERGLHPAPEADREAMLRRASYVLTGLPPTAERRRAFLADERPDAWARLIDELLASPHHGETWGRHWLDVVRYAETNGYERDTTKPLIWRYRDRVIEAFQNDLPYDRFLHEQLAGDELPDRTTESLIATGYYRLGIWDDEPGDGQLLARYDVLDDIVRTTSEGVLGMTLGCARCHDHKGDPITQRETYAFMAYFHGLTPMSVRGFLQPAEIAGESEAFRERRESHRRRIAELERARGEEVARLGEKLAREGGLVTARRSPLRVEVLPSLDAASGPSRELRGERLSLPAEAGAVRAEAELRLAGAGEHRFRVQGARPSLVIGGREILTAGNPREEGFLLAEVELAAGEQPLRLLASTDGAALRLHHRPPSRPRWRRTETDPGPGWTSEEHEDSGWALGEAGFGRRGTPGALIGTAWESSRIWLRRRFVWPEGAQDPVLVVHHDEDVEVFVNGHLALRRPGYRGDYGVFALSEVAISGLREGENTLAVHCRQTGGGQFVDVHCVPRAWLTELTPREVAEGWQPLLAPAAVRPEALLALARTQSLLGEDGAPLREIDRKLAEARKAAPRPPMVAAVQETGPVPAPLHVHRRGNPHNPGERVEPGVPAVLNLPPPDAPEPTRDGASSGRRLALARWLTGPARHLTARVMVNRIWQHHFGRGIVRTPNDFGELGARPTHPELLDWLAGEFIRSGWSLHHLHRLLMNSSAWRMGTLTTPEHRERDGANDLFGRRRARRLNAEELRDSILWATGRLNPQRGGPSFYEPLQRAVLATASRPDAAWGRSPESQTLRRSVYRFIKRSLSDPLLALYDAADTDAGCPVRFETTTPTQALTLMNGEFIHRHLPHFAARLMREAETLESRVGLALRLVCGREPREGEVEGDVAWLRQLRAEFSLDESRALQAYGLLLFNSNDFLYLD